MDRAHNGPVMVASPCGGMDIEEVAESTPEKIFVEPVDINEGPKREQTLSLAKKIGFDENVIPEAADQIERLYDLFINSDATQVEINPLVQTDDKKVYCIDAKINFDDNAEFRQKEIFAMHDTAEDDQREVEAAKVFFFLLPPSPSPSLFPSSSSFFLLPPSPSPSPLSPRPNCNTSVSTVTSVASSTELVLPWPPWISSSIMVVTLLTFVILEEGPLRLV